MNKIELLDDGKERTQAEWFTWCLEKRYRLCGAEEILHLFIKGGKEKEHVQGILNNLLSYVVTADCINERVVALGVGSYDGFSLYANVNVGDGSALGVRLGKEKKRRGQKMKCRKCKVRVFTNTLGSLSCRRCGGDFDADECKVE